MLGRLVAHYWSLLIILCGIVKLSEHQQAKREGTRASGIGVGGVFLLCCLIVAGLIATQATRVNWTGLHDEIAGTMKISATYSAVVTATLTISARHFPWVVACTWFLTAAPSTL